MKTTLSILTILLALSCGTKYGDNDFTIEQDLDCNQTPPCNLETTIYKGHNQLMNWTVPLISDTTCHNQKAIAEKKVAFFKKCLCTE